MNDPAWALTVARVHKGIFLSGHTLKANFAWSLKFFFQVKDVLTGSIHDLKINRLGFFGVIDFEYNKFNPS